MLRKRKRIYVGHIAEEGYLLGGFCNAHAEDGDAEIFPYNCITCYTYNYRMQCWEQRINPDGAYCIASDLETCFAYAKKHGLRILRVTTLDRKEVWEKSMEDVETELFGGPCRCGESNLEWEGADS